jgi:hypothetical protein
MSVPSAFAARKKTMNRAAQQETSMPSGVVGGAARTAGAVAGTAVATAGAIATAPFNPALMGPVSTITARVANRGRQ